jgi:hypothetical protein
MTPEQFEPIRERILKFYRERNDRIHILNVGDTGIGKSGVMRFSNADTKNCTIDELSTINPTILPNLYGTLRFQLMRPQRDCK